MKMWKTAAVCVVSGSICAGSVFSQQAQPQPQPGVRNPANTARPGQAQPGQSQAQHSQGQHISLNQQSLATCVAIANQEEIALIQLAEDKTKDEDIKEFNKKILEDHKEFLKKLQRFTPEARQESLQTASTSGQSGVTTAGGTAQDRARDNNATNAADRNDATRTRQPIQQTGAQGSSQDTVTALELQREMAQQCLADSKKMLSEKDGAEFDACYMGMQVGKHAAMATSLKVLKRHASGEFAQLLDEGLQTTEEHLKQAEKIHGQIVSIKSDDSSRSRDNKSSDPKNTPARERDRQDKSRDQ